MIKGRDIVVLSIQPWDIKIGSNCKNIATEFSKHNRVLYVNPPLDRITRYKDKNSEQVQKRLRVIKGKENGLLELQDNLWNLYPKHLSESINWLSPGMLFDKLNRRNCKLLARDIREAIDALGFKDFILFNDSSMFLGQYLESDLKPAQYTYYMRDFLIKVPYWGRHGAKAEPQLMRAVDLILNNSEYYTEYSAQFNPNSIMVGQGCDLEAFDDTNDQLEIPSDLAAIDGTIIGYVGSLTTLRLDLELLEFIARQRPDWQLVLVGPEDENFKNSVLHELSNVHFLGNKKPEQLASYIKGFDVTINPQVVNDITVGNYPRKIDEYLALGKPVVATYTKAMEMFNEHVYLGHNKEDYIVLIERALQEHNQDRAMLRAGFAKGHTWQNNVAEIYQAINQSLKSKNYATSPSN